MKRSNHYIQKLRKQQKFQQLKEEKKEKYQRQKWISEDVQTDTRG